MFKKFIYLNTLKGTGSNEDPVILAPGDEPLALYGVGDIPDGGEERQGRSRNGRRRNFRG